MKSQELTSRSDSAEVDFRRPSEVTSVEAGLSAARTVYWWILVALLVAYALSGTTEIAPGEIGLTRRFGQLVQINGQVVVHRPGLLFALPQPFDRVERIPVKQERIIEIRLQPDDVQNGDLSSGRPQYLLTGDRSVLGMSLEVRYRIADPAAWLLSTADPDSLIQRIVIAATSAVVGQWPGDDVLRRQKRTTQDSSLALQAAVLEVVKARTAELNLGVELTGIEFTAVQPPESLRDAFVAIQDARVDQESLREEAKGEAAEIQLNAERMALVAIADAKGKLDSVLGRVAAELELFEAELEAFESDSSGVTLNRLRREAWESILKATGRVIAVPTGERAEGLWLSVPDSEKSR